MQIASKEQTNPANGAEKSLPARERIPMSIPVAKLAVPEIPGFHCHWMRGDDMRLKQALQAGYVFVDQDEVNLNRFGLADGAEDSGHTDLGSRVSVLGGTGENGDAQRLYLMKLPLEFWDADQMKLEERQEKVAAALRGDKGFSKAGDDASNRYSKGESANLFQPKRKRSM
jgi:hypothetical protein